MMRHPLRAAMLLTGLALLLAASPAAAQSDAPGDLTDSLVACWDMDEASGVRYDSWGDHHLTDNNTVGAVAGLVGNAAHFVPANAEYLSFIHSSDFSIVTGYSIYAIVESSNLNPDVYHNAVFGIRDEQLLTFSDSGTQVRYYIYDTSVARWKYAYISAPSDGWHTLIGVYDNGYTTISVDNSTGVSTSIDNTSATTNEINIAKWHYTDQYADIDLDTLAIWQRAITNGERLWLYNDGAGRSCAEIIATAPQPVSAAVIPLDENTNYIIEYTFSFGEIATVIALSLVLLAIVLPKILEVVDRWFP